MKGKAFDEKIMHAPEKAAHTPALKWDPCVAFSSVQFLCAREPRFHNS
jgi:hypothetical protein